MSITIYLDESKTAELEPSEGDDRNGYWISPFEVPTSIFLHCDSGFTDVRAVTFTYTGGEEGNVWTDLDESTDPAIKVRRGQHSQKILQLTFGIPVSVDELPAIGERLKNRAKTFKVLAARFNYQMIAAIFQNWQRMVEPVE